MCELCREISKQWPDDDSELTDEQFDALFVAAREVELLRGGPHSVGTGVSAEGVYTWVYETKAPRPC